MTIELKTRYDIERMLIPFGQAARKTGYDSTAVIEIRRQHLKMILDQCAASNKKFTDNTFNHYRKYLSMLFGEVLELDALEINPIRDIKKKRILKKDKVVLSADERIKVDAFFREHFPDYRRLWRSSFTAAAV